MPRKLTYSVPTVFLTSLYLVKSPESMAEVKRPCLSSIQELRQELLTGSGSLLVPCMNT